MANFYELSHLREDQRTIQDYSFPELRKEKLALYEEAQDFFSRDFFSQPEPEAISFLGSLSAEQKTDAMEFLGGIAEIITEQINKLEHDETPDSEQQDTLQDLKAEQSRVNRFLITLGYFK